MHCIMWFVILLFSMNEQVFSLNPTLTRGQIWPLPQYLSTQQSFLTINPSKFSFKITNETSDILQQAVERYTDVIKNTLRPTLRHRDPAVCTSGSDVLSEVEVSVMTAPVEVWPHLGMDEHYELHVNSTRHEKTAVISSDTVWGALRGLETFSQLVYPSPTPGCLMVNNTDILDYPRFRHRGLLLDTSRHYLSLHVIYTILSAMEMNKMNVFHWHIVDDQSFPYQSYTFPNLSEEGAYDPKHLIYSQENVKKILEYARVRGIRVVPEFDSPGHTQSWGKGVSKLLTPCFTNKTFNGKFGPIDPSRSQNFKFVRDLLEEVKNVFPDKYIHIGGDEVAYGCWESNPAINTFMQENNITTYAELEGFYVKEVLSITNTLGASGIVWQEVFQHNATLRNDTVVHIWVGNRSSLLNQVTGSGNFALLSEGWYLDHINKQWQDYYQVDPMDFNGTRRQRDLVLGGEACMWGEMVDETNIVPRIWPRASAAAERLWSSKNTNKIEEAEARLNEHVCRMKRRGVAAQPANGPGFCPY